MFWFKITVTGLILLAVALFAYIAHFHFLYFAVMMAFIGTMSLIINIIVALIELWFYQKL